MPGTSKGKPRGRGWKSSGHTYGECSKKRAFIKQRVHVLEQALVVQDDVIVTLMRDFDALEGLVHYLTTLHPGEGDHLIPTRRYVNKSTTAPKRTHVFNEDGVLVEERPKD